MIMYVGLPFANIDLEVNIKSYNKEHEYAGLYSDFSNIRKKITLNIKKEYSLDVIVSINYIVRKLDIIKKDYIIYL